MLQAIREHAQGWIARIILALIIVTFAIWGVDWYFQGGGQGAEVANVNGESISQPEFFQALKSRRDSLQESLGGQAKIDIENKEFRQGVLDQLVEARVLSSTATKAGFLVPQDRVSEMIASVPAFQSNGRFSEDLFESWLRNRDLGRANFMRLVQQDMLLRQVQYGYGEGAIIAASSAAQLSNLLSQKREVNEAIFAAKDYLNTVTIDEKAVAAEYNANSKDYAVPAQVRLQYVVLSADAIRDQISVSDAQAQQYYEANKNRFQDPEQRRASHILIKADAGMTPSAKAAAKAKAEKLLQEVRGNPGRFGDLAKQLSEDPGSAPGGGDLGFFTRDMMVKPFADATFSLKQGEISNLVESEFGYHIIRLDGITPAKQQGFDVVRDGIVEELRQQEAQRKFAEVADRFSNMVYEQAESLQPVVKEFNLSLLESGWVSREKAEPAMLANPKLMDAVFAPDVLEKQQNSEAIEVAPSTLVAARVIEHKPAGTLPLSVVADQIRARLVSQAARTKAIAAGQQALKAAQSGQPVSGMSAAMTVSRMQPLNLPPEAVKTIFKAAVNKLPAFAGVESPEGYRLYRISQVLPGDADANREKTIQRDLAQLMAQEEMKAYLAFSKGRAKIEINSAQLGQKAE